MSDTETQAASVDVQLCLDFANITEWHTGENSQKNLPNYEEFVAWGQQFEVLSADEAEHLNHQASQHLVEAEATIQLAIELREAIFCIFTAVAKGHPPDADDLSVLNAIIAQAQQRRRLVYTSQAFEWDWIPGSDQLDRILWSIALSAVKLLTSDRLVRVKRCANNDCGWLFIDATRNRSRRWCDMSDCGNRAKARRFYQRKRAARATDDDD